MARVEGGHGCSSCRPSHVTALRYRWSKLCNERVRATGPAGEAPVLRTIGASSSRVVSAVAKLSLTSSSVPCGIRAAMAPEFLALRFPWYVTPPARQQGIVQTMLSHQPAVSVEHLTHLAAEGRAYLRLQFGMNPYRWFRWFVRCNRNRPIRSANWSAE